MQSQRQPWEARQKRLFLDMVEALNAQVPLGVVLDGEAVIWNRDRHLMPCKGMVTAKAALPALVRDMSAAFAAFDVLAVAGQDIREVPLRGRSQLLEELAKGWAAPSHFSPTTDMEVARTRLRELPATGVEGLGIKGHDQPDS